MHQGKEVRRILDPRHNTERATLTAALRELGRQLVIGVQAAAWAGLIARPSFGGLTDGWITV